MASDHRHGALRSMILRAKWDTSTEDGGRVAIRLNLEAVTASVLPARLWRCHPYFTLATVVPADPWSGDRHLAGMGDVRFAPASRSSTTGDAFPMGLQQIIDSVPIVGVFTGFAIASLAATECGYRVGRWLQSHTADETEGPTGMIVGSLLALMAFLLAITVGMATDRFDTRRGLVLAEANALGTTYLRAGYLPAPFSGDVRTLLGEYVSLRAATGNEADVRSNIARSTEIHADLWSMAEQMARAAPESEVLGLFIESLNEVIDLHGKRVTVGIYARVPLTVLLLLLFGSLLTLTMVGYNAGLGGRRNPVTTIVLAIVPGAVIALVFDLDRPQGGSLKVSQQPLIDLRQQIRQ